MSTLVRLPSIVIILAAQVTAPIEAANASGASVISGGVTSSPQRLSGGDRFATSVAISGEFAADVPVVYVATGLNYPDALSAAPAAAAQGGPLLLTEPGARPDGVLREIERLAPAKIVVVGGVAAVSTVVYGELAQLAPMVRRDSGADRYETSPPLMPAHSRWAAQRLSSAPGRIFATR